ncbi:MAG: hypothetical protein HY885_15980, partial [Deltaproteobacteria bacterium]|nr:hypothetical protein [Deltaproteobacteria bacterium]
NHREIINEIDWNMTPEKAVDMYLEWGAGWTRGNDFVSGNNQSIYFVLFDWETPPQATLIRRNMKEAVELAKIPVPDNFFREACAEDGYRPGGTVHRLNDRLKQWLAKEISGPPVDLST